MFLYRVKRVTYGALLGLALPISALGAAPVAKDDLSREINKTMTAIESYPPAQRDRAVADGESLLQAIDRRLILLETDAETAGDGSRQDWLETRVRLQDLRREAGEQLQVLRGASEQAWSDAKHRFHSAVDELGEAFEDATAQLGAS